MFAEEHKEPRVYKLVYVGLEERVVGAHIMGKGLDEMMQGFGVAMKTGATRQDLDDIVTIHLMYAEGVCFRFVSCHSRLMVPFISQSWSHCGKTEYPTPTNSPEAACRRIRICLTLFGRWIQECL